MTKPNFWNTDRIMWLIIGLAIAAAVVMLIRYLSDVLLPFFVACFVAYMLQPLVDLNRKWIHEKGRIFASLLTIVEVSAVIAGLGYLFIPHIIQELEMLGSILHNLTAGKTALPPEYTAIINFVHQYYNPDDIRQLLTGSHLGTVISKGTSLLSASIDMIIHFLGWALTLVYILFILIDYPKISAGFKAIIPGKYRKQGMNVVRDVEENMNSYFRGQGMVALFAMVFYCVGFSIVGFPLAIPMGVLVGILYMIPYFQYVTLIPVAIICLIYSLGGEADFVKLFGGSLLVYVVSQSICDYIVTPHIMGKELGMNPAVILLSLSIWGSLLGIIGMIIALPVSSLIMAYYERYISLPGLDEQG